MRPGLLFTVLASLVIADSSPGQVKAPWQGDYQKARQMARQSKKPMFLVFR